MFILALIVDNSHIYVKTYYLVYFYQIYLTIFRSCFNYILTFLIIIFL